MSEKSRYRFGPLERRGLIAGWRGGQVVTVTAGLVVAVSALRTCAPAVGFAIAGISVLGACALACWPIAGRTGEEWSPTVVRWMTRVVFGRRTTSPAPLLGQLISSRPLVDDIQSEFGSSHESLRLPRSVARKRDWVGDLRGNPFSAYELCECPIDGPAGDLRSTSEQVGVVRDRRTRTLTAVLAVSGQTFALLGSEDKDRRAVDWATVLAAHAREGGALHRLQWVASCCPDASQDAWRHLRSNSTVPESSPNYTSYQDLLAAADDRRCLRQVFIAVQVREGRLTSTKRDSASPYSLLVREATQLVRALKDAGLSVEQILDKMALSALFHRLGSPGNTSPQVQFGTGHCGPEERQGQQQQSVSRGSGWPWPMALEQSWSRIRTDAVWHATYWIAEWPRIDVGPDFLAPMLLATGRRAVSLTMEPLSPSRASRQVAHARTADIADSELRRRGGFVTTVRRSRESELVIQREAELADGHASVRFSGYVTVTANSVDELEVECERAERCGVQSRLELRRMYGEQERALLYTLPLCLGLS